jgi:hypothetical protein
MFHVRRHTRTGGGFRTLTTCDSLFRRRGLKKNMNCAFRQDHAKKTTLKIDSAES